MQLPESFKQQMTTYFPDKWPAFAQAIAQEPIRAARLQKYTGKSATAHAQKPSQGESYRAAAIDSETSHDNTNLSSPWITAGVLPPAPASVTKRFSASVPWYEDAYYIDVHSDLGKTVWHELGGVYLQEPSATAAVSALHPRPGERILDLCGAPGSKATAIGRRLAGNTLLYANEIHPQRVNILAQNLERAGIPAVITNNHPQALAETWPGRFDGVLVDAPCSGEGMFRKDPDAVLEWSPENVNQCAIRQRDILRHAIQLVKPGGRLVYSTCTLNPIENEQIIAWACNHFPVELEELPDWPGWEQGRAEFANDNVNLHFTRRLWPQDLGEGHFVARLRVLDSVSNKHSATGHRSAIGQPSSTGEPSSRGRLARSRKHSDKRHSDWKNWLQEVVDVDVLFAMCDEFEIRGDGLFLFTNHELPRGKLKFVRDGVCVAQQHHERWTPHHQLAMVLNPALWRLQRSLDAEEVTAFLAGGALSQSSTAGWTGLTFNGLPVGLGKSVPGRLNNLYPKGLRRAHLIAD